MDPLQPQDTTEFLLRRVPWGSNPGEDCPMWAVLVPVVFALLVVGLIVILRPDKKILSGLIGLFVVGAVSIVYLPISLFLVFVLKWWVVLVPVMGVAFF